MSTPSDVTATTSASMRHPKLTPYRLAFFLITGGLGTAKTVLALQGQVSSPTTIDWIAGVVMALSFQFLGAYEYKSHRSTYIDWMFSPFFLTVSTMRVSRSDSRGLAVTASHIQSDDLGKANSTPHSPPIVTMYRLLVSISVSIFGIAKMLCGYFGLSTDMNTLDWIMAVPLTLGLYYIGLYEERKTSVPRVLFDVEYSARVRPSLVRGMYCIGGLYQCGFWLKFCLEMFQGAATLWDGEGQTIWEIGSRRIIKWAVITFILAMFEVGVLGVGVVLWPIIKVWSGRRASSISKHTFRFALVTFYFFSAAIVTELALFSLLGMARIFPESDVGMPLQVIFVGMLLITTVASMVSSFFLLVLARRAWKGDSTVPLSNPPRSGLLSSK